MATVTFPQVEHSPRIRKAAPTVEPAAVEKASALTTKAERSFWRIQAVSVPLGILGVFVLTAAIEFFVAGGFAGPMGLGLYMAFWLGLGSGFMVGGVIWGLEQEAADAAQAAHRAEERRKAV